MKWWKIEESWRYKIRQILINGEKNTLDEQINYWYWSYRDRITDYTITNRILIEKRINSESTPVNHRVERNERLEQIDTTIQNRSSYRGWQMALCQTSTTANNRIKLGLWMAKELFSSRWEPKKE